MTTRLKAEPDPVQARFDDNAPDTLTNLPVRAASEVAALPDNNAERRQTEEYKTETIDRQQALTVGGNKVSRITLSAVYPSWIQVRDTKENRLILSKVLLKGHSYQVPNRLGLSLMTGNAGALKILVDGKAVPDVGKLGEVRRKVLLEVESLRQGQAVLE